MKFEFMAKPTGSSVFQALPWKRQAKGCLLGLRQASFDVDEFLVIKSQNTTGELPRRKPGIGPDDVAVFHHFTYKSKGETSRTATKVRFCMEKLKSNWLTGQYILQTMYRWLKQTV